MAVTYRLSETAAAAGQSADAGLAILQSFSGDLLAYAVVFLVLAVLAAIAGASGIAGISVEIAKWLVIIFVVLAVITLIL